MRGNVFGHDAHRANHAVIAQGRACEHGGMVGHANTNADGRVLEGHVWCLERAVGVRVNVDKIGQAGTVMQRHAADVVHQNVAVKRHVVAHLEVVTDAELHPWEGFEISSNPFENMICQHAPKAHAKLDALGGWRKVKVVPEPQERFDLGKFFRVNYRVIFRLERDVVRVEVERRNRGFGKNVGVTRAVKKLRQEISTEFVAVGTRVLELGG